MDLIMSHMDLKSLLNGSDMVSIGPDKDLMRTLIDLKKPYMDLIWSHMDLKSLLYGPDMDSYGPDKEFYKPREAYIDLWSLLESIISHIYLKWHLIDLKRSRKDLERPLMDLIRSYMDLKVPLDRRT